MVDDESIKRGLLEKVGAVEKSLPRIKKLIEQGKIASSNVPYERISVLDPQGVEVFVIDTKEDEVIFYIPCAILEEQ